jgi:hypothetical protein
MIDRKQNNAKAWEFARKFQKFMDGQASGVDHSATVRIEVDGNIYRVSTHGSMVIMEDGGDGVELHVNVQRVSGVRDVLPVGKRPVLGPKPTNRGRSCG